MKSVLCFGDSNTWGAIPGSDTGRFGPDVRWPSVMNERLGPDVTVYEAGLNGRTTVFDRLPWGWRNGKDLLVPTIEVCAPLDVVIVLLGTNDASLPYVSAVEIASGAGELITIIRCCDGFGPRSGLAPLPLLVAPHVVGVLGAEDEQVSPGARERSVELVDEYRRLAEALKCHFVDLSSAVEPSDVDPWHWEPAGHQAAADLIGAEVRRILD